MRRGRGRRNRILLIACLGSMAVLLLALIIVLVLAVTGGGSKGAPDADPGAASRADDGFEELFGKAKGQEEAGETREQESVSYEEEGDRDRLDYEDDSLWAYLPDESELSDPEKMADVFYVSPTAIQGNADKYVIDLEDEEDRYEFRGCIGIQKGIYDDRARFYSPFYREMTLMGYYKEFDPDDREELLSRGYEDVKNAFLTYQEKHSEGRPLVLAGFSQGGDMVKRLLCDDELKIDPLVAAYIIGWNVTDEDKGRIEARGFHMAGGELDTGAVISFCSEAESMDETFVVPGYMYTNGINPLNWSTGEDKADRSDNPGSCVELGFDSSIKKELLHCCGAYRDRDRGTLKITGVSPDRFYPDLGCTVPGDYHVWDYRFFYRSLEKNVQSRIGVYLGMDEASLKDFCKKTEAEDVSEYEEKKPQEPPAPSADPSQVIPTVPQTPAVDPAAVPQTPAVDPAAVPQTPAVDPAAPPQTPAVDPAALPQTPAVDPAAVPQTPAVDPAAVPQTPAVDPAALPQVPAVDPAAVPAV